MPVNLHKHVNANFHEFLWLAIIKQQICYCFMYTDNFLYIFNQSKMQWGSSSFRLPGLQIYGGPGSLTHDFKI